MHPSLKKLLRALSLDLRHTLEGSYDAQGSFHPGDLERRLNELGVWRERPARPLEELPHLAPEDRAARRVVDAYIAYRLEAQVARPEAVAEFVRQSAYTWANRLLALRCMEARGQIDEVILQKDVYGGRSLAHHRLARRDPAACVGPDEGLFRVLLDEFAARAAELPEIFDPKAPAVALRPSLAALKRCLELLSAPDELFAAPDALGWAYQYWNTEEKERVFEKVRTQKAKIAGADIIPATQLYTEPYMVKFLVQNSLGALWLGMHPQSKLAEGWEYYVKDAERAPVEPKPASEITLLDPALGSGHFHLEAFDLFLAMYLEEAQWNEEKPQITQIFTEEEKSVPSVKSVVASILNHNLYGIDIDGRAIQIAAAALWMKAKDAAPDLQASDLTAFHEHLAAADLRLPQGVDHLKAFLEKHPEARPLRPALQTIFDGLQNVHELGSLVQIEEPVEKELRYLKEQFDAARGRPEQLALFAELRQPKQGELPLGLESYAAWKAHTLAQLEQHFAEEAETADAVQAFFGQSACQGLALFDVLARHYDVVVANPPYMGSKNMTEMFKRYVERHYKPGKRDLYAAFIFRCLGLAHFTGRVAMVTQQSWMFLNQLSQLRKHILEDTTIEVVAHLGRYAFSEIGNAAVQPVMFILSRSKNVDTQICFFRLHFPRPSHEQQLLLQAAVAGEQPSLVYYRHQELFSKIDGYPLSYWLPDYILEQFSLRPLREKLSAKVGIQTGDTARYLRYFWESTGLSGWRLYSKGGKTKRWYGVVDRCVRWWDFPESKCPPIFASTPDPDLFLRESLTYTMAGNSVMAARLKPAGIVTDIKAPIISSDDLYGAMSLLNSRLLTYFLRSTTGTIDFSPGYVEKCIGPSLPITSQRIAKSIMELKENLVQLDMNEVFFDPKLLSIDNLLLYQSAIGASILVLESANERQVLDSYAGNDELAQDVFTETGTPPGLYTLISTKDVLIPGFDLSDIIGKADAVKSVDLESDELSIVRNRLGLLYQAGPGISDNDGEDNSDADKENVNNDEDVVEIQKSLLPETFIEELSQKLRIHPISVYWLLKEGIEQEGWRCLLEEKRLAEDRLTVLVLRLLGHRWPRQIEAGEPVPPWADADGILPLSEAFGEATLFHRLRARLEEERLTTDYTDDTEENLCKSVEICGSEMRGSEMRGSASFEREFAELTGEPLETWLAASFYKRHISQFKKRPIAWQLSSRPAAGKKKGLGRAPAFTCLVYYHKLDADLLPKLRSQYVGPLRQRYATELRTLEGLALSTPEQTARRVQLQAWIEELQDFEARLSAVEQEGFAAPGLAERLSAELHASAAPDAWCSRDGRAPAPASSAEFILQEQRYDPDLNDGVRVNIAPLQKAGLLAADVLDAKDLEKAIADRAAWRADERRWCREGKLPRPGWWGVK